jgi:hypothetical protein
VWLVQELRRPNFAHHAGEPIMAWPPPAPPLMVMPTANFSLPVASNPELVAERNGSVAGGGRARHRLLQGNGQAA